jgi:hypothetical protein
MYKHAVPNMRCSISFAAFLCLGLSVLSATAEITYTVPWFTGPEADASGVYTDANGAEWRLIGLQFLGLTYASAVPMKWIAGESRWVMSNSTGSQSLPHQGSYEPGPELHHPAATDQKKHPAITFLVPYTGIYRFEGTLQISGERPRILIQIFPAAGGAPAFHPAAYSPAGPLTHELWMISPDPGCNHFTLDAGDRVAIHFYTLKDPSGVDGVAHLGGPDPLRIILANEPVVPMAIASMTREGTVALSFQSVADRFYQLEYSTTGTGVVWTVASGILRGTGGVLSAYDATGYSTQKTYRVVQVGSGNLPPADGLIRAAHIGLSNDITMLDNMQAAGMNGALVGMCGHLYDPGSNLPTKEQMELGPGQLAVFNLWQPETFARGMIYYPMIEWWGTGDRLRWSVDNPYVDLTGTVYANTPCPMDENFWTQKVERCCIKIAELIVGQPNIGGLFMDTEMYGGDVSQYPDACYCTDCIQQVANHLGITVGDIDLGDPADVAAYRVAAVEIGEVLAQGVYDTVQAIVPGLPMGGYVLDNVNLTPERDVSPFYIGTTLGWGEPGNPALVFSEKTYGRGWHSGLDPNGFSSLCNFPMHVQRHLALLAQWNADAEMVLGLNIIGVHHDVVAENLFHMAVNTRGYWIYDGLALGDHSLWVLQGGGKPAYQDAIKAANDELDKWEAALGFHWSTLRIRPFINAP